MTGLAWLWKTWQETAPGPLPARSRPQQQTSSVDDGFDDFDAPSQASPGGIDWRSAGAAQSNANSGESVGYPAQAVSIQSYQLFGYYLFMKCSYSNHCSLEA